MNREASTSTLLSTILALPKSSLVLVALGLVGMVAWLDYATGWEWDVSVMYALPLVLVVFAAGRRAGLALASFCAITWWAARINAHPYLNVWEFALALATVFFFLAVIVVASAAAKSQWELGRARIEMLERMHDLEREITDVSEREQQRIGRELHDGLCQTLAGIAALSTTLSRRLRAKSEDEASAAAAEITQLLSAAIGEVRDLARGLVPVSLQGADLVTALEALALNVSRNFGVSCTLNSDGRVPRLGDEFEAHLYRIAQQAINNALTHGQTDRIEIGLRYDNGEGRLTVHDNGVGLSDEVRQNNGIGLGTMAYRAQVLGGSLEVRRQTPRGTEVACVFPLPVAPDTRENPDHARHDC